MIYRATSRLNSDRHFHNLLLTGVQNENDDYADIGFSAEHLIKLATWKMPFGKYAGRRLIDLPEAYLFWFQKHEFPAGELGELMKLCLELRIEGLDGLIKPLKSPASLGPIED